MAMSLKSVGSILMEAIWQAMPRSLYFVSASKYDQLKRWLISLTSFIVVRLSCHHHIILVWDQSSCIFLSKAGVLLELTYSTPGSPIFLAVSS